MGLSTSLLSAVEKWAPLCHVPLVPGSPGLWTPTWEQEAPLEAGGGDALLPGLCWEDPGVSWRRHEGSIDWGPQTSWAMGIRGSA